MSKTSETKRSNVSGLRIRELRESMGFSQERLAIKLQLEGYDASQKTISRIETGARHVTDYELLLFSDVLGVSVVVLLQMDK